MNAMKKILALALAGVMALALLTGCGTGGSASHKSIDETMAWNSAASENAAGCFSCRIEVRDDLVFVV